jgi:ribosomal protein L11 methyltransferase
VPYRVDVPHGDSAAFDRLVELGALDAEVLEDDRLAALMPNRVRPQEVAHALGVEHLTVSPASGRDAGSVWVLRLRPFRVGRLRIVPAGAAAETGDLQLTDSGAFGTGLHPTTRLCLEILEELVETDHPLSMLDVGTGSGILALGALLLGVPRATGIDIDAGALEAAAENARVNRLDGRLELIAGDASAIDGTWPLVTANVLAAPLIEMGPALVRRIGHRGQLVLSGIPSGVAEDVDRAYRSLGLQRVRAARREDWTALLLRASW